MVVLVVLVVLVMVMMVMVGEESTAAEPDGAAETASGPRPRQECGLMPGG